MRHIPVLLQEVIESLNLTPGKNIIDCTLGDAGHAEEILKHTAPDGKLLGIDADPEALLRSKKFLYAYGDRVLFERNNFDQISSLVAQHTFGPVHGILMDLGWSSPQFEERGRGFSFLKPEEPLDMRYGTNFQFSIYNLQNPTAHELINDLEQGELEKIFKEYGEEKLSREIAQEIVEKRKEKSIKNVGDLVDIVLQAYRKKLRTNKEIPWVGGLHPATKVFQALRIVVNDELGVIERALPQALDTLVSGGRLAVITFHSLEDRIAKHFFKAHTNIVDIITKRPIACSQAEGEENPRARSAKLRVVQKK